MRGSRCGLLVSRSPARRLGPHDHADGIGAKPRGYSPPPRSTSVAPFVKARPRGSLSCFGGTATVCRVIRRFDVSRRAGGPLPCRLADDVSTFRGGGSEREVGAAPSDGGRSW